MDFDVKKDTESPAYLLFAKSREREKQEPQDDDSQNYDYENPVIYQENIDNRNHENNKGDDIKLT